MADIFSNGVSGLLAFQTALNTTSHNISNVSTPGYSRQTTDFVTNAAGSTTTGWQGNGVSVAGISRSYDQILAADTRSATSSYNQLNTVATLSGNINNLLGDPTSGLSASLTGFTNSVQTMANSPSNSSARQAVLSQAQALVSQFQSYQGSLDQLKTQVTSGVTSEAGAITSLAQSIAGLNGKIVSAQTETGQPPNDLLDQRDALIDQLSQHVGVSTVTQDDGSVNVFIGSGEPLVVGVNPAALTVGGDQYNSGAQRILMQSGASKVDITDSITSGTLGGVLQFRSQVLTPAVNTLGQSAVTLASLINTQNKAGLDQNGAVGADLLGVGSSTVLPSSSNAGAETVSAGVTDLSNLTANNYVLKYNGTAWSLTDAASGAVTSLTATTSGSTTTLTGAGLTLTVGNATGAQQGDKFLVEPTSSAVYGLKLLTGDPAKIAAAGPLVTAPATANSGTASIVSSAITSPTTWGGARGNYTLTFTASNAWQVTDSSGTSVATGSYTAGTPIAFNGIQLNVSGTPTTGDNFSLKDNANGTGDNSNALKLAGLASQTVLGGGKLSLSGAITQYLGQVGLQTSQAQSGATTQKAVLQSAQNEQSSVSGVNLDEEAANLLKYQQAYQAAAQSIKIAGTLFQSLLSAVQG